MRSEVDDRVGLARTNGLNLQLRVAEEKWSTIYIHWWGRLTFTIADPWLLWSTLGESYLQGLA